MESAIPKISVIMPVYNTGPYLNESIGSILGQTLMDIELIINNDGSSDNSLDIINQFASNDDRVKVLTQVNSGQSIARNKCLDIASGDYIYFMDSDDILDKDTLESCYNKCIADNLDMVIFDGESFFDDKKQKPIFDYSRVGDLKEVIYNGTDMVKELLHINKFSSSPCLYLIHRSVIEDNKLRFYPGIIHEDNLFTTLAFLYCHRIGTIRKSFFHRRIRGSSTMTSIIKWKNIKGYLVTCSEILSLSPHMDKENQEVIGLYVSKTMTAVCYKARFLSFQERVRFFKILLKEYRQYVSLIDIIKVLIPK